MRIARTASLSEVEVGEVVAFRLRAPDTATGAAAEEEDDEQRSMKKGRIFPWKRWDLFKLEEAAAS